MIVSRPPIALLLLAASLVAVADPGPWTSTGIVTADRRVTLEPKITGRITAVAAEEGETVEAGQLLVTLDDAELQAELSAALAALSLARVEREQAERADARIQRLFKTKSVSEDQLDAARFAHAAAVERVRAAEAQVALARARLDETRLKAPFAGVIVERRAEIGQLTRPGEPLLVLEDQDRLTLRTRVKEQDIPHVSLGDRVVVVIDALGTGALEATVSKIVPSGDASHSFVVEADLPPTPRLYPGMFGKARFGR